MTNPILALALLGVVACGGNAKTAASTDTSGPVKIAWLVTQAEGENVDVTLVVAGQKVPLGTLNAMSDDAPGTPSTCAVQRNAQPTKTVFVCGATPAYNSFALELKGSELVIHRVSGVDGDPNSDRNDEVKRIAVKGAFLEVAPYAAK
jgi:hypothetical protein